MNEYTKEMLSTFIKEGLISPDAAYIRQFDNKYLPDIKEYNAQTMVGSGVTPTTRNGTDPYSPHDIMFLLRDYDRKIKDTPPLSEKRNYWNTRKKNTQYHELDHILANRAGSKYKHPIVDDLGPSGATQLEQDLNSTIRKNKEAILKQFPETAMTAYWHQYAPINELMATLTSLEDTYNIDIPSHPLFKDAFKNKNYVDSFRASSGYRRTRMDARDPKPYTTDKGFWQGLLDIFK